ncbi:hypothetical protein WJX77_012441 [Trebouxia sp. C0004]
MDTPDCPVDVSKAVHALLGIPLPKVPTGTQPVKPRADRPRTAFKWLAKTPEQSWLHLFCLCTDECNKGCSGPTLKTLQRFGTFGRRSNGPDPTSLSSGTADRKAKQAKYMYLSIDEAATHVGNKRGCSYQAVLQYQAGVAGVDIYWPQAVASMPVALNARKRRAKSHCCQRLKPDAYNLGLLALPHTILKASGNPHEVSSMFMYQESSSGDVASSDDSLKLIEYYQESRQHLQKLKRKLDLQADQQEQGRRKIATMEKDIFCSRSEVHWLRRRVSQLQEAQHVAKSTAARAATTSQYFDYIEPTQPWQQENLLELPFESSGAEQQASAALWSLIQERGVVIECPVYKVRYYRRGALNLARSFSLISAWFALWDDAQSDIEQNMKYHSAIENAARVAELGSKLQTNAVAEHMLFVEVAQAVFLGVLTTKQVAVILVHVNPGRLSLDNMLNSTGQNKM